METKSTKVSPLRHLIFSSYRLTAQNSNRSIPVGVILDLGTHVGKMAQTSIEMAVEDFYMVHWNYSTRLVLYTRDSNQDNVKATLAVNRNAVLFSVCQMGDHAVLRNTRSEHNTAADTAQLSTAPPFSSSRPASTQSPITAAPRSPPASPSSPAPAPNSSSLSLYSTCSFFLFVFSIFQK